jgi:hypothetical protein
MAAGKENSREDNVGQNDVHNQGVIGFSPFTLLM